MPKPVPLKLLLKVIQLNGFVLASQRGSHAKFRKIGTPTLTTIVKMSKKEIPYGTFRAILLQTNLKENDFRKK
jgi:predicted RNA binding protein YcfA (HicA-like mRNA interferase family)